ncbi:MAG: DUF1573 domain-containing protein [bacterium]|jgi:hypothetical protein
MKKLLVVVMLVFAVSIVMAQQEDQKNGPQITFKNTLHEYGDIEMGSDGSYSFVFTNTGNEPLILSKPRSSCGCTVPAWPKEPILPGESNKIKVTYNTSKVGSFNKTVTVYSNAKNKSAIILRIKGKVVPQAKDALPTKETSMSGAPVNK